MISNDLSQAIQRHWHTAVALSDDLYAHPETAHQEFRSSHKVVELLRQSGYQVEYPYMGYPTAFRGVLKNGEGPSAAILVEYDALPGLGHACGHNAHCAMAVLAALAMADLKDRFQGTVYVFGTPAEEEAGGSIAAASVAPAQDDAKSSSSEPSVEDAAAAESAASAAAREAVAHARSVMGNVGRAKAPSRVSYSSAEGTESSASSSGGNRAERRAAAKKRRRR